MIKLGMKSGNYQEEEKKVSCLGEMDNNIAVREQKEFEDEIRVRDWEGQDNME